MAQDRKVFVGGVPQDLNQDDLYAIFSEYAGVKKAWLQKCRTNDDGSGNNSCPPQNHRGFGFVIFHDAHAIDELLGSLPSRFIVLRSGAKLEVKRALSSNKMGQQENATGSTQAQGPEAGGRGSRSQQQAYRAAHDLPSSHVVGSVSQQRATQPGPLRELRQRAAAAAAVQQQAAVLQAARYGASQGQAHLLAGAAPHAPGALTENQILLEALNLRQAAVSANASLVGAQPPGLAVTSLAAVLGVTGPAGQSVHSGDVLLGGAAGQQQLRAMVMRFYNEHCPEKLTELDLIDAICQVYEGREEELDSALREKYGRGLQLPQGRPSSGGLDHQLGRSLLAGQARVSAAAAQAAALGEARPAPGLGGLTGEPAYAASHLEAWGTRKALGQIDAASGLGQGPSTPRKARGRFGPQAQGLMGWMDGDTGNPFSFAGGFPSYEPEVTSPDLSWVHQIVDDEEKEGTPFRTFAGKAGLRRQDWLAQTYAVR